MSDLFELQLAADFPGTLAASDIALLHWHLGINPVDGLQGAGGDVEESRLLSSRGPAHRIGGALTAELCSGPRGWALAARQEMHPDEFDELHELLTWLGARTTTVGTVGSLRFYEAEIPDVLIADAGGVRRIVLQADGVAEPPLLPDCQ